MSDNKSPERLAIDEAFKPRPAVDSPIDASEANKLAYVMSFTQLDADAATLLLIEHGGNGYAAVEAQKAAYSPERRTGKYSGVPNIWGIA